MKIFLVGWFGPGNMGDEAILMSELLFLREEIKDVEFYILSFDPEKTKRLTADIPEVKHILRMGSKGHVVKSNFFGILKTFRKTDLVVIGGGGIFQDIYNHYPIPFFTAMALLAKLHRKQLVLYCLGIGPINTFIGKMLCKFTANLADLVSVRDSPSKDLLKNIGVTNEVHLSTDPVFLLDAVRNDKVEKVINKINNTGNKGPIISVCVHDLFYWSDRHKAILADTLDTLTMERSAKVVFFALGAYKDGWLCKSGSDAVDIAASKKLIALMKGDCLLINDELTPQELLAVMEDLDLIISMRLHGLIMGLNRGIPVIALTYIYESKLRSLMKRIDQEDSLFDISSLDKRRLLNRIEYLLHKKHHVNTHLKSIVSCLRAESEKFNQLMFQTVLKGTNREQ